MAYTSKFTAKQLETQLQDQAWEAQMTADIIVLKTQTEEGRVDDSDCFEYQGEKVTPGEMLSICITTLCQMCKKLDKAAAAAAPTLSPLADAAEDREGGSREEVQRVENATPAAEAPPEQPRPVLTVDVELANKSFGGGKNLKAALDATEEPAEEPTDKRVDFLPQTLTSERPGASGEGEKGEKKRKRADWQREGVYILTGRDIKFHGPEEGTYFHGKVLKDNGEDLIKVAYEDWKNGYGEKVEMIPYECLYKTYPTKWPLVGRCAWRERKVAEGHAETHTSSLSPPRPGSPPPSTP